MERELTLKKVSNIKKREMESIPDDCAYTGLNIQCVTISGLREQPDVERGNWKLVIGA